jgi:hypothetical protein
LERSTRVSHHSGINEDCSVEQAVEMRMFFPTGMTFLSTFSLMIWILLVGVLAV